VFNGVTMHTIATAGECMVKADWQTSSVRQVEEGLVCFTGPFDGHVAFPMVKDGKTVMRYITNSEIRPRSSSGFTGLTAPKFYVSTNPAKGGWGEEPPSADEKLNLMGATLMYIDIDRDDYTVLDMGYAIKKVFTIKPEYYNTAIPADVKSDSVYAILDNCSYLHNNVRADQTTPRTVTSEMCMDTPEFCGLYAHCGSSLSRKHQYSYASPTTDGELIDGIGFEDDIMIVSHEGSFAEGGLDGVMQALDIAAGNYYQLPQVSVGETEIGFAISTGHPDYVAMIIQEYGLDGVHDGCNNVTFPTGCASSFGSRISLYIGKKDRSESASFLDRNGLGVHQGWVYHYVTDSGETDTATVLNWPASGTDCSAFTPSTGRFEPLPRSFDGRYSDAAGNPLWTAAFTNGAKTLYGNEPMRMTEQASLEWGSMSPSNPGAFAICHTGLAGYVLFSCPASLMPMCVRSHPSRGGFGPPKLSILLLAKCSCERVSSCALPA
jgi:hypothetical protein